MANNELRLENGIFGHRGYQAGGALDQKPGDPKVFGPDITCGNNGPDEIAF